MKKTTAGLVIFALILALLSGCADSSSAISSSSQPTSSVDVSSLANSSISSQDISSTLVSSSLPISSQSVSSQPVLLPPSANEIFFFVNNMFLGSYRDGAWRKSGFTVSEVLAHSYQLYKQDGTAKKVASAGMETGSGLAGFTPENGALINQFSTGMKQGYSDFHYFNLPTAIVGAAAQVPMPDYNASLIFNETTYPLATNTTFNLVPRPVKTDVTPEDNMKKAVRNVLDGLGLTELQMNITQVYECDLAGDGRTQQVVVANVPKDKDGNLIDKSARAYSLCIVLDATNVQVLKVTPPNAPGYGKMVLYGCFDLNHDGKYEILIDDIGYEWGSDRVYSLNDQNTWTEVLTCNYGQ